MTNYCKIVDGYATIGTIAEADLPFDVDGKQDRHGFENRTDSTLSFDNGDLEFTITGNFNIFNQGDKIAKTTESIVIDNTNGLWFIYYNSSNVLSKSQLAWTIGTDIPIAVVFWNGATGLIGDERHGLFDAQTHLWAHHVFKTMYDTGLTGTFGNTTFSIDNGTIFDEDIEVTIPTTTQARIFYRSGSDFTFTAQQTNYTQVSGSFQYDNSGTLTAVDTSKYFAVWVYATNFVSDGIIFVLGQRQDTTLNNARNNNLPENLNLTGLNVPEMKLLYRVILQNSANPYIEQVDYRQTKVSGSNILVTDHQTLANRSAANAHPATSISTTTTNFNGNLSTADTTVQAALDTLDNLTIPTNINGWMRKSVISDSATFNAGVATYVFSWQTATYSKNWNTSINRTTTDRLTNTLTSEELLRDNACIEIATTDLDKNNITQCYAELHWARYDENDTLIEELILDKAWVMMVAAGGTIGDLWGDENLFLQGDIEYTLDEDHYSKMWVEVYYDGPGANVSLSNGMQEHHHFKY